MQRYKGASGDAGVMHFDPGPDSITLRFKNRTLYLYDYAKTGKHRGRSQEEIGRKRQRPDDLYQSTSKKPLREEAEVNRRKK